MVISPGQTELAVAPKNVAIEFVSKGPTFVDGSPFPSGELGVVRTSYDSSWKGTGT